MQVGTQADRQLIFIDRNRDLYMVPIAKRVPAKLGSMVDSARWHDTTGMLAAMVDQKLVSCKEACGRQDLPSLCY
jgi:intraflagellar transport protein 80